MGRLPKEVGRNGGGIKKNKQMTSREEGLTGEVACQCEFGGPASEMLSKCIFFFFFLNCIRGLCRGGTRCRKTALLLLKRSQIGSVM